MSDLVDRLAMMSSDPSQLFYSDMNCWDMATLLSELIPAHLAAQDQIAALTAENDRLRAALSEYHTTFCEGWCEELPTGAAFEDCSGCAARVALLNKPLS